MVGQSPSDRAHHEGGGADHVGDGPTSAGVGDLLRCPGARPAEVHQLAGLGYPWKYYSQTSWQVIIIETKLGLFVQNKTK